MQKALHNLPVLDADALRAKASSWKTGLKAAGPGGNRVVIEWGVARGPHCFVYPAGKRADGVTLVDTKLNGGQSDERWADFLEYTYVPTVVDALKTEGVPPQVICVDLRPLQIQRERRRAIDKAAQEKTGASH